MRRRRRGCSRSTSIGCARTLMSSIFRRCSIPRLHSSKHGQRVSLTFDDGYVDNYEYAFPLLAARGMPAAFFLTAGFLERDEAVMQRLAVIWRTPCAALAPLAWSQVVEMQAAGMTVGSHTWSHPNLSQLPVLVAKHELTRSKDVIEQRTGAAVDTLAYPFGKWGEHVDATTLRLAEVAGYEVGYASSPRAVAAPRRPVQGSALRSW